MLGDGDELDDANAVCVGDCESLAVPDNVATSLGAWLGTALADGDALVDWVSDGIDDAEFDTLCDGVVEPDLVGDGDALPDIVCVGIADADFETLGDAVVEPDPVGDGDVVPDLDGAEEALIAPELDVVAVGDALDDGGFTQAVAPVSPSVVVPAGQEVHSAVPLVGANVLTGHNVHAAEPAVELEPGGQLAQ